MACDWVVFSLFVTIIAFNLDKSSGFNVDTENFIRHRGAAGSMFGFSVAEHRDRGYSWVLVGAPEAQTAQPGVVRGGAVFRCDVSRDDACQEVPFDVNGNLINSDGRTVDNKTAQWFGATVQSSGEDGVVVACAPRYVWHSQNVNRRDPVGTCYVARNSFSEYSEYSPCRTRNWGHHRQGSCQAGLGASISKDGERLYVGAVGSWYWQGQVYSIDPLVQLPYTPPGYRYPYGTGQLFSQSLSNRPNVVFTREGLALDDDSYLGYSVAVGDFGDVGGGGAAVGMPRGDGLYGKILFYSWNLTNHLNLTGEQLGAYFGYSLCVSDMDGDGRDDLIVGAPLFTHLLNKDDKYETGRIYVFYQTREYDNRFDWVDKRDGKNSKSRFGLALTSLGDINRDRYGDIAVGAPYDGPSGRGAVYIYHGSDKGIMEKPSQIILAEDVLSTLSTFGFSISGGVDLDENQYPDLVVGAYEADTAVFLRARPVVNLTASITFLEESKQIILEEQKCTLKDSKIKVTCTELSACFTYNGIGIDQKMDFEVEFVLDAKKPKNPRMFFLSDVGRNVMNHTLHLDKDSSFCKTFFVYIKDGIRDKLTPLEAEMRYSLKQQTGRRRVTRSLIPVLDHSKHILRRDSVNIQKNCGPDNICIPDLNIRVTPSVQRYLLGSENLLELNILVENKGEDSFETIYTMTVPEGVNYVRIEQEQKELLCSAPSRLNNNTLKCDIGNPLRANRIVQFQVKLKPTLVEVSKKHYEFEINVNSTNPEEEGTMQDNSLKLVIPIWVDAQLELSGHSDPPDLHYNMSVFTSTAPVFETEVGPHILHTYTIFNRGPSEIKEAEAYFVWPSFTEDDENILYLMEVRNPDNYIPLKCEFLEGAKANALGLKLDWKKKQSTETSSSTSSSSSSTTFTSSSSGSSSSDIHKETSQKGGQDHFGHGNRWLTYTEEERMRILEEEKLEEEEARKIGDVRVSGGSSYQETHYESSSGTQAGSATHSQGVQDNKRGSSGGSFYHETHHESSSGVETGRETHRQGVVDNRGRGGQGGISGSGGTYHETHYNLSSGGHLGGEDHRQGVVDSRGRGGQGGISSSGGNAGTYHETRYESSSGGHLGGDNNRGSAGGRGISSYNYTYSNWTSEGNDGSNVGVTAYGRGAQETSSRGESHHRTSSSSAESGYTRGSSGSSVYGSRGGGSTTYVDSSGPVQTSGGINHHHGANWSSGDAYGSNYDRRTEGGFYGGSKEFHVSEETSDIQDNIGASYQGSHHSTGSGRTGSRDQASWSERGQSHGQGSSNQFNSDLEQAARGSGGLQHFVWTPEVSGRSSSGSVNVSRETSGRERVGGNSNIGIQTDQERRYSAGGIGYERSGGRQHGGSSSTSQSSWNVQHGSTGDNVDYNAGRGGQDFNYGRQHSSSQSGHVDGQLGREHSGGSHYSSSQYESSSSWSSSDGGYTENKLETGNPDDQTASGLKHYRKYRHSGSNENGEVHHRRQRRQIDNSELKRMTHCNASKCSVMKCVIGRLEKEEQIIFELRFRVWVQTLKTFGYSKPVNVSSLLATRLTRLPYIGTPQEESLKSVEVVTEVVATDAPLKPEIVPLWIVILSACAGTLILLLLIFVLWKCGFFKRNRPSSAPEKEPLNRNGHYEPGDEAL